MYIKKKVNQLTPIFFFFSKANQSTIIQQRESIRTKGHLGLTRGTKYFGTGISFKDYIYIVAKSENFFQEGQAKYIMKKFKSKE